VIPMNDFSFSIFPCDAEEDEESSCKILTCEREVFCNELCEIHYYQRENADKIKEKYDTPLKELALMLHEYNEQWLIQKPDTIGAEWIRKTGLTQTQISLLEEAENKMKKKENEDNNSLVAGLYHPTVNVGD